MGNALKINGLEIALDNDSFDDSGIVAARFGRKVHRDAAAMAASPETLFTVNGECAILGIVGKVTSAIQGQATTIGLDFDPTGAGASADLSAATADLNAAAAGIRISLNGAAATALQLTVIGKMCDTFPVVNDGIITGVYGAASTGEIEWDLYYVPLEDGATIVAS